MYLQLDEVGPQHAQLLRALKAAILQGRVATGARLPATRELAQELGLSRNTVLSAYEQLTAEGFIHGKVGSGSYVAAVQLGDAPGAIVDSVAPSSRYTDRLRNDPQRLAALRHQDLRYNLQYGEPLVNPALTTVWRRELAHAASYADLRYTMAYGLPALREAICDYLARRRGVQTRPENVLIVNGSQQALSLAARVLLDEGDPVVLEEPPYFGARRVFHVHGARIIGVRTDREGLVCDELPVPAPKLVCVTPSHQFPAGSVLSLPRRQALLNYASEHGCWVLEDDYDGEFRYDVRPLAALHALDHGQRVIYVGTFSKVLFPSLRLGYMVLPSALREDFAQAKWLGDFGCPAIEQAALANFIANGGFERHLRQATKQLKARRQALVEGLRRHAGDRVELVDSHAGMHLVAWLRGYDAARCAQLVELARSVGIGLHPIATHYLVATGRQGFLMGYAGLPPAEISTAMRLFGQCLDQMESR